METYRDVHEGNPRDLDCKYVMLLKVKKSKLKFKFFGMNSKFFLTIVRVVIRYATAVFYGVIHHTFRHAVPICVLREKV